MRDLKNESPFGLLYFTMMIKARLVHLLEYFLEKFKACVNVAHLWCLNEAAHEKRSKTHCA